MKKLILIACVMASAACSTTRDWKQLTVQVGNYGLQAYVDKANNKIIYLYRDEDGSALTSESLGAK
jgi:hypothetical protein